MGLQADSRANAAIADRLEAMLRWDDQRLYGQAPAVSSWSIAQQVEHVVRASTRMLDMIELLGSGAAHERVRPHGKPSMTGRAILLTGHIPRGRADAPDGTRPDAVPRRAALTEATTAFIERVRRRSEDAGPLRGFEGVGQHPLLGWFTASQWWRFLRVHAEHHLAVIDDIDGHRGVADPLPSPTDPVTRPSTP